jgi:predicted secreted protein
VARALPFALAALLLAAPAAAETIDVRPELALQGSTPFHAAVAAHVGDTVRIDLPDQTGTGYAWTIAIEGGVLEAGRTETGPAPRPGGLTRQLFTFRAVAPGSSRVVLVYRRPWETGSPPARQVVVSVDVAEREAPPAPGDQP